FEVDHKAAEALRLSLPALSDAAWANRGFHQRAATWLATEAGLRQFIDIGSGLPTVGNTHQVVQRIDPAARVVYADIDPMARAGLKGGTGGRRGDGSTPRGEPRQSRSPPALASRPA